MTKRSEYGAYEWLRSHRVGLGPFYVALPIAAVAGLTRFVEPIAALALLGATTVAAAYWALRARGWRRPYFMIGIVAADLWMIAARFTSAGWQWLGVAWFCLTVALAIPWWADQVRRTQVIMETTVRNWPIRAQRVGLKGTSLVDVRGTDIGWSGKLTWLPGTYTVEDVQARRTQIEGALGLLTGELRMPEDGRSTNSVRLVAVTDDPHARPLFWDIPTELVDGEHVLKSGTVTKPFRIGVREDGTEKTLALYVPGHGARQILIGGIKGSGKSGLLNLIWANLALFRDVVQWGIDLKGGVELGPWARAFDWTVETVEDAWLMIHAATAEMERRQAYMKARGWKQWKVDQEHPLLVISIDEAATLLGSAKSSDLEAYADLARKARACGIVLIVATQFPTLEALGSSQIRSQIDQRFCFRMAAGDGEGYVIPDYRVDAHKIPADRPGTCYHQDGETLDRMPMRILYVDDRDDENVITQLVSLVAGFTPSLGEKATETILAVAPIYAEREIPIPTQRDGSPSVNENESESADGENETVSVDLSETAQALSIEEITQARRDALAAEERAEVDRLVAEATVEVEQLSAAEARDRLAEHMRTTEQPVRVDELTEVTTRSRSWCYERLRELEARGEVRRTDLGWRWVAKVGNSA